MSKKSSNLSSLISTWLQSLKNITGKITLWRSFKSEQMPVIPKDFEELTARLAEEVALVSGVENGLLLSKLLRMLQAACWSVEIRENPYNKIPLAHIDRTKLMLSSLRNDLGAKVESCQPKDEKKPPGLSSDRFSAEIKITNALVDYHLDGNGKLCLGLAPMKQKDIFKKAKVDQRTVVRYMKKVFGGMNAYKVAAKSGSIVKKLIERRDEKVSRHRSYEE